MECLAPCLNHAKTDPCIQTTLKTSSSNCVPNGLSLARIAPRLHVSQRTLVDWNRQLPPDIRALRAVHLEALHEQTLASREEPDYIQPIIGP